MTLSLCVNDVNNANRAVMMTVSAITVAIATKWLTHQTCVHRVATAKIAATIPGHASTVKDVRRHAAVMTSVAHVVAARAAALAGTATVAAAVMTKILSNVGTAADVKTAAHARHVVTATTM